MSITAVFGSYERCLFGFELVSRKSSNATKEKDNSDSEEENVENENDDTTEPLLLKQLFSYAPHLNCVKALDSSGRMLVSGSADEVMNVYDLKKLREVGQMHNHGGSITVVAFAGSNSTHMISGSSDGMMCLWKAKTWNLLHSIQAHHGEVVALAMHPSGRLALSLGQDNKLKIWNLLTAKLSKDLTLEHRANEVKFNPTGDRFVINFPDQKRIHVYKIIAAAGEEGTVGVWDAEKGFLHAIKLAHPTEDKDSEDEDEDKDMDKDKGKNQGKKDKPADELLTIGRVRCIVPLPDITHLLSGYDTNETLPYVIIACSDGRIIVLGLTNGDVIATTNTQARITCATVTVVPKDSPNGGSQETKETTNKKKNRNRNRNKNENKNKNKTPEITSKETAISDTKPTHPLKSSLKTTSPKTTQATSPSPTPKPKTTSLKSTSSSAPPQSKPKTTPETASTPKSTPKKAISSTPKSTTDSKPKSAAKRTADTANTTNTASTTEKNKSKKRKTRE